MAATEAVPEIVFRRKVLHYYRRCRTAQMDRLRATWEFAVWFNEFAESNALDFRSIVEDLRRDHRLGWRYKTVLIYRTLGWFEWDELLSARLLDGKRVSSVRTALQWARDQRRSAGEQPEKSEKPKVRENRPMAREERLKWAAERTRIRDERDALRAEVARLSSALEAALARIAELEDENATGTAQRGRHAPFGGACLPSDTALLRDRAKPRDWR